MDLNYEEYGGGVPVIIMHGLFGSLANWRGVGRALSDTYRVINVDLRNHGHSPHGPGLSYTDMADDILRLMDKLGIERARLMGHSLGGKLAMVLADRDPERITRLVVVDIAPKRYPPWHQDVFNALHAVDLETLDSRATARHIMAEHIFDSEVRAFLAANLEFDRAEGRWHWRFDLEELTRAYPETSEMPKLNGFYCGPAMFIRGAQSAYIESSDRSIIQRDFPGSCIVTLPQAKHWPHIEDPKGFLTAVRDFFKGGCAEPLSHGVA